MKKKGGMGFGNIGGLFKQMQNMQKKIAEVDKRLELVESVGISGGGEGGDQDSECVCVGNGKYYLSRISIGKRFLKALGKEDGELLNSLLLSTVQSYFDVVIASSSSDVASMASAMGMPLDAFGLSGGPAANKMDLGNINALMKQVQGMQKQIADVDRRLDSSDFEGSSGEGDSRCYVRGSGKYRISTFSIGSRFTDFMGTDESELMTDLLIACIHDYCKKVKNNSGANIAGVASGMGLPMDMLDGQLANLLGTEDEFE